MGYATAANLTPLITQSELIRLTDENDLGVVNAATVTAALAAADVEIDSYLRVRYTLPIATQQPLLTGLAVDIAIWNLYSLDGSGVPENRKERYQAAVKTLERISSGKQTLDVPATASEDSSATYSGPDRLFSRDTMSGI
jgi:phage gp36-like protein